MNANANETERRNLEAEYLVAWGQHAGELLSTPVFEAIVTDIFRTATDNDLANLLGDDMVDPDALHHGRLEVLRRRAGGIRRKHLPS